MYCFFFVFGLYPQVPADPLFGSNKLFWLSYIRMYPLAYVCVSMCAGLFLFLFCVLSIVSFLSRIETRNTHRLKPATLPKCLPML